MPKLKAIHICNSQQPARKPKKKNSKEYVFSNAVRRLRKNTERTTAVLQKWRCSASYDIEVVNQNLVLRMKFSGENRHLRKAENRYVQYG
ncbi:MAG: hypothetical protein FJX80_02660 [Bacteroidetes bacterium]|nr:hypothetical protein [Bacteroidota bacterium]